MEKNATPKDLAIYVYDEIQGSKMGDKKPTLKILTDLFETLYYTSLQTEEGQFIKLIVTLLDHHNLETEDDEAQFDEWKFFPFHSAHDFSIKNLVKLSKAVDPWSASLSVYYDKNEDIYIYGMIDQTIHYQRFLNYEREDRPGHPGIIQVMITGIGILSVMIDYQPLATLNQNILIKTYPNVLQFGPISEFLRKKCGYNRTTMEKVVGYSVDEDELEELNDLVYTTVTQAISRILLRIKNYGHGGAILITTDFVVDLKIKYKIRYNWINSGIKHLIASSTDNEFLADEVKALKRKGKQMPIQLHEDSDNSELFIEDADNELIGAIRFVSSLSCVDGLVLLSPLLTVNEFGTIITEKDLPSFVHVAKASKPTKTSKIKPEHCGTRHQSMFLYCHKYEDSVGFVVSQDGEIRAVKSVDGNLVIWENIKIYQFQRSIKLPRKPVVIRPT